MHRHGEGSLSLKRNVPYNNAIKTLKSLFSQFFYYGNHKLIKIVSIDTLIKIWYLKWTYIFNFAFPATHPVFYKQQGPNNSLMSSNLNLLCKYCSTPTYNHNYLLAYIRSFWRVPGFQPERL